MSATYSPQVPVPTILSGDCIEVMRTLPDNSVDSIVTDPPYGLGFMGKAWDALPPGEDWARECLRVLKPGGHLLAFGGTRTWHRLAVAVEDAGFEIRDSIAWLYGTGFPKSLDVSKAIDKAAGAEREVVGSVQQPRMSNSYGRTPGEHDRRPAQLDVTAPATDEAKAWAGWGTALKPAFEPVVVGRKPLVGTVAQNVLEYGTGALNIDGCRVGTEVLPASVRGVSKIGTFEGADGNVTPERTGRWPANVVLDESQADTLDEAARFFYVAKAPKSERPVIEHEDGTRTAHPTVKPLALMRYLVRLVTPPGGVVLEPFAGSGTTVEAAMLEGFECIAIERDPDYLPLIEARVARATNTLTGQS